MGMTTSEAIKRIQHHMEVHHIGEYPHFHICEALTMAIDALREKEEDRWIPVTERMPEERNSIVPGLGTVSKPVLVTWVDPTSDKNFPEDRFVRESITRNGEFTLSHINGDLVPVAWKPYPKPSKEEPHEN